MSTETESFNGGEINNFTKNKFEAALSNFPNLTMIPDNEIDLNVFNTKLLNLEIPQKTINQLYSYFQHERQQHPNPQGARNLNTFTVEWLLDSKFMNYALFDSWANGTLYGIAARQRISGQPALLRDNCIDRFDVYMLDNTAKFPTAMISFHKVFLTGLGSIQLQFGTADVVTFSTTFEYEQMGISIQRKKPDGTYVLEPLTNSYISTRGREKA